MKYDAFNISTFNKLTDLSTAMFNQNFFDGLFHNTVNSQSYRAIWKLLYEEFTTIYWVPLLMRSVDKKDAF